MQTWLLSYYQLSPFDIVVVFFLRAWHILIYWTIILFRLTVQKQEMKEEKKKHEKILMGK